MNDYLTKFLQVRLPVGFARPASAAAAEKAEPKRERVKTFSIYRYVSVKLPLIHVFSQTALTRGRGCMKTRLAFYCARG